MHKGLIFTKNQNQAVPEDFLKLMVERYPSCQGAALVLKPEVEGGANTMEVLARPTAPTVDGINKVQDMFQEDLVVFYLGGSTDKTVSEESLQPMVLVKNDQGHPVIAGFITGHYPGYKEEKSVHSDAFFVAEKYLRLKLNKLYNSVGADVRKFLDELRDPLFQREVDNLFVGDCQITLLAITGEVITFAESNKKLGRYDWGMTADCEGYGAAAPGAKETKRTLGAMVGEAATAIKSVVMQPGRKEQQQTPHVPETPKEEVKPAATNAGETVMPTAQFKGKLVQAPKNLKGKKIKQWYNRNAGFVPTDWAYFPTVQSRVFSDLADITIPEADDNKPVPEVVKPTEEPKKDATVHNKDIAKLALPSQTLEVTPIIPKVEKDHIKELLDKGILIRTLDNNSQDIPQPESLQKAEARYPSFCKQNNIPNMEVTRYWSFTNVVEHMAKRDPIGMAKLWADTRAEWEKALKLLEGYTAPKVEETEAPTRQLPDRSPAPVTQKEAKKSVVMQPQRKLAM